MDCLRNGHLQILHLADRAGRKVVLEIPGLRNFQSLENEMRARFYLFLTLLQSQDVQTNGVVIVSYGVGDGLREYLNGRGFSQHTRMGLAIPLKCVGLHNATDHLGHYIRMQEGLTMTPPKVRTRFKLHHGSHAQVQKQLLTYGIPTEAIPLLDNDDIGVDLSFH